MMEPLRDESLREQAVRSIRTAIITGGLAAGEVYSAPALAQQLRVSATPVREAMLDLAREGLVSVVRNRGFRVLELSEEDLDEIFQLRDFLEVPAVGLLAGRLSKLDQAPLLGTAMSIEACAESGDLEGFLDADRRFHLGLLAHLPNRRLVDLVARLRDQSRLYGLKRLVSEGSLVASAHEHRRILEAVVRGERQLVEQLMRAHVRHTRGIWAGRAEEAEQSGSVGEHRATEQGDDGARREPVGSGEATSRR